ncbi:DUF5985 family protein [Azospirillum rugosum]|uniref:Cyclic nucleotide-binding protein n=1 Tax=Azospirillum rugosum TaxID=416170 RepID=A0ABS4SW87_9PROT|nr:DUF5985 family protein [Azospirillum rugosum]MBP2296820.1 hypothetical protein [Azospirillum rugosum]MDQ0530423.1 hypothetical protein [Azospirillum rugosum]
MMPETYLFLSGMIAMGYAVAGLFFLRFWRRTKDGLFLNFAGAFGLLALGQAVVALGSPAREESGWMYLIRLVAFGLIIVAIVRKNLNGR